jgi:hypothetical protein
VGSSTHGGRNRIGCAGVQETLKEGFRQARGGCIARHCGLTGGPRRINLGLGERPWLLVAGQNLCIDGHGSSITMVEVH